MHADSRAQEIRMPLLGGVVITATTARVSSCESPSEETTKINPEAAR
jgi:hypothetical protein